MEIELCDESRQQAKETKKLYTAYKIAKDIVPLENILEYLHNNNIEYLEYREDGLISLHGDTEGHAETVLIWHKDGKTTGARFDEFL